ncbi:MAG TPA: MogA/MoaB family molybdenum cofactor biosynthesis protein [Polyangia bacterium]|nr:MogA/MoaB family molybdenum cofactor biosynthesis protein [Polyangia bacterium]
MEAVACVLVASDSRSAGRNADLAGPAAVAALSDIGIGVLDVAVVPDDRKAIADKLIEWCGRDDVALIVTAGGTGLAPRDVTPEATRDVIEREVPGIPELLRAESLKLTPHAALSRAAAGVRNRTLIVNMPGSPRGVRESIGFLARLLPHALETVTGRAVECARR